MGIVESTYAELKQQELKNNSCPIIVEYMNDRFDKKLLQYIQDNEENGMRFMAEYYAD